jgi:TonB family protein
VTFLGLAGGWSLQILVVGACAEAVAPLLGRAHPRVRARYWSLVLTLALVGPWLLSPLPGTASVGSGSFLVVASSAVDRTLRSVGSSGQALVAWIWAAVALLLLARLGRGVYRLAGIARASRPLAPVGDSDAARIHETDLVLSPASSFIGRLILVPPGFLALPEAWREAAVVHESIHLRRGHGVLLILEEVLLSLFWFHPVVFRMIRRVRDSREEVVDAETVEATGAPSDYRDMLIGLASRLTLPAPAVSGTTALRARIESLSSLEENPMPRISRLRLIVPVLALTGAAALAAHAAPLQATAAPKEAEKAKAGQAPRKVVSKVSPVYPAALKEKKISGLVQIVVTIDASGAVTSAVARPDDNPDLAKAAIDAIRQWRFEPGPGNAKMTHTIDFRLSGESEKK